MRILLDECVPKRLRASLVGHDVRTATEMGWSAKKNGELLAAMNASGFDVLLIVDQNLRYQQNVPSYAVAIVVLIGNSNRIADLAPLMPKTLAALGSLKSGDVVEIVG
jgi:hypothetical protein